MEVTVLLQKAINVLASDDGGTSDPYCVVSFLPNKGKKCSYVIWKTLDPVWNQTINFEILNFTELLVVVYDKDVKGADYLGEVRIPKSAIIQLPQEVFKEFQLPLQGNEREFPGIVPTGDIFLSVSWKEIKIKESKQKDIENKLKFRGPWNSNADPTSNSFVLVTAPRKVEEKKELPRWQAATPRSSALE